MAKESSSNDAVKIKVGDNQKLGAPKIPVKGKPSETNNNSNKNKK